MITQMAKGRALCPIFSWAWNIHIMLQNCVKREPWLPSVGENPSNAFEVTTRLGNKTDSQPLSDQKVIKAVTLEFRGGKYMLREMSQASCQLTFPLTQNRN